MAWLVAKNVHVALVALSLAGFLLRGAMMLAGSPLLSTKVVRVAPHVVDTLLLASAIALAVLVQQYPLVHGWLTAKVLGLLAYIGLGSVALRYGRTKAVRGWAFAGALAAAAYVVGVAITRNALWPVQ